MKRAEVSEHAARKSAEEQAPEATAAKYEVHGRDSPMRVIHRVTHSFFISSSLLSLGIERAHASSAIRRGLHGVSVAVAYRFIPAF